ncbi:MAG TPA: DNA replication and repair protein RecF [Victivallales bacterium]|nr:DNA replication and repair protein RecF [Victivallales bacterium]
MISKILLSNFRNYQNQVIDINSKINVLVGENGQGKTNLLESIYFLAFLRSFRTSNIQYLKKIGSKGFYIAAQIAANGWEKFIEAEFLYKKNLRIDNIQVSKSSNFVGQIRPIVFTHEDIKLVSGSSRVRRKYIDILLSSLDRNYLIILQNYIRALKSRNILLRKKNKDISHISAYEPILAKFAVQILHYRYSIIDKLSLKSDLIIKEIKGNANDFNIKYISKIKNELISEEYISELLKSERDKDILRGYTGVGPHLDDFDFFLNNKNLKHFGSIGQARLASLSLKMGEIELITDNNPEYNVIALVDDVSGELDEKTKDEFYKTISKVNQLFFTFTRYDEESYFKNATKFSVFEGKLT